MSTKATKIEVEPNVNVLLALVKAEAATENRQALRPMDVSAVAAGGEPVIVLRDIKLSGQMHKKGSEVSLQPVDIERLAAAGYITTREKWDAAQSASKKSKYLRDIIFPLEGVYNTARRAEAEAIDRVARLESELLQARHAVTMATSQREATERELALALKEVTPPDGFVVHGASIPF